MSWAYCEYMVQSSGSGNGIAACKPDSRTYRTSRYSLSGFQWRLTYLLVEAETEMRCEYDCKRDCKYIGIGLQNVAKYYDD